jgi:valyl-tRNA synthetase
LIGYIRNFRSEKQISPKDPISLKIKTSSDQIYKEFQTVISKMANVSEMEFVTDKVEGASGFIIGLDEFFIPLEGKVDVEEEKARLQKELEYQEGFLKSVMKKLGNESFVNNAPANVVEMEKKKRAGAEAKIKTLKDGLKDLK